VSSSCRTSIEPWRPSPSPVEPSKSALAFTTLFWLRNVDLLANAESFVFPRENKNGWLIAGIVVVVVLVLVTLILAVHIVGSVRKGVVFRFGRVVGEKSRAVFIVPL